MQLRTIGQNAQWQYMLNRNTRDPSLLMISESVSSLSGNHCCNAATLGKKGPYRHASRRSRVRKGQFGLREYVQSDMGVLQFFWIYLSFAKVVATLPYSVRGSKEPILILGATKDSEAVVYSMETSEPSKAITPRNVKAAYRTVCQ